MIIKHKKTGTEFDLQTQQYETGLYVCIYKNGRLFDQFGVDQTREKYLKHIKTEFDVVK